MRNCFEIESNNENSCVQCHSLESWIGEHVVQVWCAHKVEEGQSKHNQTF